MGSGIRRIPKKYWKVYPDIEIQYVCRFRGGAYAFYYSKGEKRFICRNRGNYTPYAYEDYNPNRRKNRYVATCYRINGYYIIANELEHYYPDVQDLPEDQVDFIEPSEYVEPNQEKKEEKALKDFIYKVDDSNKITTQTGYDSIDEFFSEPITNDIKLDTLVICTIDTKEPLIKLQKVETEDKTEFKFIVDIINENGDNFIFKSIIKSQEQLNQLIQQTIEALKNYPKFSKYADDLENCL